MERKQMECAEHVEVLEDCLSGSTTRKVCTLEKIARMIARITWRFWKTKEQSGREDGEDGRVCTRKLNGRCADD